MFAFNRYKKFHFVGIGGAGMCAIADVLLQQGFAVSGSDANDSEMLRYLAGKGAEVYVGHAAAQFKDADIVIVTSAVNKANPEVAAALEKGLPVIKRAEMLGQMMRFSYGIGVAGTHGKTTTTAMTSHVLEAGDLDPMTLVGGTMRGANSNVRFGEGPYFVAEADEYDQSFLQLWPCAAIITNIDADHLECYGSLENLHSAFVEFANRVPFFGRQIVCADDKGVREILPRLKGPLLTYGLAENTDLTARAICLADLTKDGADSGEVCNRFQVRHKGDLLGEIQLRVPGRHNIQNALAAIAVGLELQIPFGKIAAGLAGFGGVKRRLEVRGALPNDILVIDDYGHHPTEMTASLNALKAGYGRRMVLVFQPHLFSRTQAFVQEFGQALLLADVAIVSKVYPAREAPLPGVSGQLLVDAARALGHCNAHYADGLKEAESRLRELMQPGDVVVTMGAGDVNTVIDYILKTRF